MYSYQHRYHAGGLADLHKHVVLLAVLAALKQKETAFCVLDAFAGEGLYDLNSKESQRNQEYLPGFAKARRMTTAPEFAQTLFKIAQQYQIEDKTFIYPGSPALISASLRAQDKAIFVENHPQAYKQLRELCAKDQQVHLHKRDSFEASKALLPFKEKRGLIFLDPSYEVKEDYDLVCTTIAECYAKFSQGIYLLWYPLLEERRHRSLRGKLQRACGEEIKLWQHELVFAEDTYSGLLGSGIIMLNPPWQFDKTIAESLAFLRKLCEK